MIASNLLYWQPTRQSTLSRDTLGWEEAWHMAPARRRTENRPTGSWLPIRPSVSQKKVWNLTQVKTQI